MAVPTQRKTQLSPFWIKVNSVALEPAEIALVVDITIEQDLILPDRFSIRLRDVGDQPGQHEQTHGALLDNDRFPVGAKIEIGLGLEEKPEGMFKGEITTLELELRETNDPIVTVRGYDGAHRLHRERASRTYRNLSDGDMASTIARAHGLTPEVDSTPSVYEHVFQDNQTDWEFLRERATRIGFEVFVADGTLSFRRPNEASAPTEEAFGETLQRLRVRVAAPTQVEEVLVQGWDPAGKREIIGRATRARAYQHADLGLSGPDVAKRMGTGRFVVTDQPVRTQQEADAHAQAVFDEISGDFVQLEGVALGDTRLRPGQKITLKNLGKRFDGDYYLSAATHRVTPTDGYMTSFTVSGRRPATLLALLRASANGDRGGSGNRRYGVVVGLVTNSNAPEFGGRVKVKFPWLTEEESWWARLAAPMAGPDRGIYYLPEVGDEVLVAFEHGDINHPYIVGSLWNGREHPPKPSSGDSVVGPTGQVNQRIIKSRLGHTITLDDSDDHPSISIVDKTGENSLVLDSSTDTLTVNVRGNIEMSAPMGSVTLNASSVSMEASGEVTIRGGIVNIN